MRCVQTSHRPTSSRMDPWCVVGYQKEMDQPESSKSSMLMPEFSFHGDTSFTPATAVTTKKTGRILVLLARRTDDTSITNSRATNALVKNAK